MGEGEQTTTLSPLMPHLPTSPSKFVEQINYQEIEQVKSKKSSSLTIL
jgi:hypothetical protein